MNNRTTKQTSGKQVSGKQQPTGASAEPTRNRKGGTAGGSSRDLRSSGVRGRNQEPKNRSASLPSSRSAGSRTSDRRGGSQAGTEAKSGSVQTFKVQETVELLVFLLATLKGQGRNAVKGILARGQVAVNERSVTAYNHMLKQGDTVSINRERQAEVPPLVGLTILHEDDDLLVVNKEAGLLSIASPTENELTAYHQLTDHVRRTDPKRRIFVVHRLDRDTSGVMMFAKSEEIQQALQTNWHEAVLERTYVALVEGNVKKPEGTISSWLKESKTLKMFSSPYPNDGQHAVTHYKTLQTSPHFSLLQVELETGRKNQIRVHMQDIGHPVVGDKKYGSKSKILGRLGLHARVLAFTHPATQEQLRFETPVPKPFLNAMQPKV